MRFLSLKSYFSNHHSTLDILLWISQTTVQNWTQSDENEWEAVLLKIKNQKINWEARYESENFFTLHSSSQWQWQMLEQCD